MTTDEIRGILKANLNVEEGDVYYAGEAIRDLLEFGRTIQEGSGILKEGNDIRLSDRISVRGQYETVALGIARALVTNGRVALLHKKLDADVSRRVEQLAIYAMVLRDPRYETFRVFYMKNGEIVATDAITSMATNEARISTKTSWADITKDMNGRAKRLSADEIYVMHNHPSGDPTPLNSPPKMVHRSTHSGSLH